MDGSDAAHTWLTTTLATDQPNEALRLQHPSWLDGVSFWKITGSARAWSFHHDGFSAWVPLDPDPGWRAVWSSRGEHRVALEGSVLLTQPGETQRTHSLSGPAAFFVCWWTTEAMERAAQALERPRGALFFKPAQLEDPTLSASLLGLCAALDADASVLELDLRHLACLELLLGQAGERSPLEPRRLARTHPSVRRALELLHASFTQNLSLDDLAREARLSKFHFAHCFRDSVGMAPHQYQKLLRLQLGRRLLEGGCSVGEAALRCGFADTAHFTRAFSCWLGVSPSKWAHAHGRPVGARHASRRRTSGVFVGPRVADDEVSDPHGPTGSAASPSV
jgi:AraC-like DNA-binding protein